MRPLTATDILTVSERDLHPIDRALTMLAAACPEMDMDHLAMLSIGRRDGLLLDLRELTLGRRMRLFGKCPGCKRYLELEIFTEDIRSKALDSEAAMREDGLDVSFRLPNSFDLSAASRLSDLASAKRLLIERCIKSISRDGEQISLEDLDEGEIGRVASRMGELDPQADVLIEMTCPDCNHVWTSIFDISAFFWKEIQAEARRILLEVHTLAWAYGWSENEILSMSASRRWSYIDMVVK
ncbi:MAG: hypothetical protein JW986_05820 [Methanotrichaceae archaeon]|nr:hypothetical protein [Methanotrichaceae archaeon]